MSSATKKSKLMKVIVEKLRPHYIQILIPYFFNDDKVTVYNDMFKRTEVRSSWCGHTWKDFYQELAVYYSLKYSHNMYCVHETFGGWHCGSTEAKSKCHYSSSKNDIHCTLITYGNCIATATSLGACWCPDIHTLHKTFEYIAMIAGIRD